MRLSQLLIRYEQKLKLSLAIRIILSIKILKRDEIIRIMKIITIRFSFEVFNLNI